MVISCNFWHGRVLDPELRPVHPDRYEKLTPPRLLCPLPHRTSVTRGPDRAIWGCRALVCPALQKVLSTHTQHLSTAVVGRWRLPCGKRSVWYRMTQSARESTVRRRWFRPGTAQDAERLSGIPAIHSTSPAPGTLVTLNLFDTGQCFLHARRCYAPCETLNDAEVQLSSVHR